MDNANAIKKALKQGVDKGKLLQKGQSFTIPGVEFQVPADEQVTIEENKVGDGDVAERGSEVTMKYRGTSKPTDPSSTPRPDSISPSAPVKSSKDGTKVSMGCAWGVSDGSSFPRSSGTASAESAGNPGDATLVFEVELLAVR